MKLVNKIVLLFSIGTILFGLAGCGSQSEPASSNETSGSGTAEQPKAPNRPRGAEKM